jgi:hypothetical protein
MLAVCVFPAFALCRLAFEYERGLYVRDAQWDLSRRESERRQLLLRKVKELPGLKANTGDEIGNQFANARLERLLGSIGLSEKGTKATEPPVYLYANAAANTVLWPVSTAPVSEAVADAQRTRFTRRSDGFDACSGEAPRARGIHKLSGGITAGVFGAVELPWADWNLGQTARHTELRPAARLWEWRTKERHLWLCGEEGTVLARSDLPQFASWNLLPPRDNGSGDGSVALAASLEGEGRSRGAAGAPPRAAGYGSTIASEALYWSGVQLWLALVALLFAMLWWVASFRRRALLAGAERVSARSLYDEERDGGLRRVFLLAPPGLRPAPLPKRASALHRLNLSSEELTAEVKAECLRADGLLIEHMEARFGDERSRLARLELLEATLLKPERAVIIVSTVDCVHYLETDGPGALGDRATPAEIARWHAVMNHFTLRGLDAACASDAPQYAAVWDSCSYQEKLVLVQLHKHKLLSPGAPAVVAALVRRGLVKRRPSGRFDFCSTGLRRFVAAAEEPQELELGRAAVVRKRIPAYAVALVLAGLVMFLSQEELTSRLVGFVTTLAGGLEALRKQLTSVTALSGEGDRRA